jgi:3-hydroxyacyl-CoA dehydrogenase
VTGFVSTSSIGRVGLVEISHPPVNALARPVRAELLAAIEDLDADPGVLAIVVHGVGRVFVAGADVREFDHPPAAPLLNDVLLRLERASKPVVAALHGPTLGGGAELALASHYRAAAADLSFGFPEISLGLLPGSGGTVRLPRLVGVPTALQMMLGGEPIGLERAKSLGLIDHVLAENVRDGAIAFAESLITSGAPVRCTRDLDVASNDAVAACAAARADLPRAARHVPAGPRIVEAVEAAAQRPFDAALAHARTLFESCRTSSESRALRHLFFAERRRPVYSASPRDVRRVGVIGAGTMGAGIATALVTSGYATVLVDSNADGLAAGMARVRTTIDGAQRKGRLTPEAARLAVERLEGRGDVRLLADCDLVIEAVFESLAIKQDVFATLGQIAKEGAVLATNTSTLDVDAIAASSGRPESVVGMHFFSPANVMKLVELVRGSASSEAALATAADVTRRIGKIAIEVGNDFAFVGNRMLYAYGREKERMLLEGATPAQIDEALEAFGMAMGPNAVNDLAGIDVGYRVRREWAGKPDEPGYYRAADLLAERGWYGQKTGRGFHRYVDGRRTPDPEVVELICAEAAQLGIAQRDHDADEIVERCMLALVNEGARLLESGIARRASDIDVIWCNGYGFPRWRGGPMQYADSLGLAKVRDRIVALTARHGERFFTPTTLLVELAAAGETFASYDAGRDATAEREIRR